MSENRKQMKPERAIERYLKEMRAEWADSTHYNNSSALSRFLDFLDQEDVDNINALDGFHISDFKIFRREVDGINEVTLYNNLCCIQGFLKWCKSKGLVESWLVEGLVLTEPDDKVASDMLDADRADQILTYLENFEYATLRHALFALLWDTGIRIGTARSLDTGRFYPKEKYIECVHLPEQDTPLKNKEDAEREVNLQSWSVEIIEDYLQMNHHSEVTDDYGRTPLFASRHGRMVTSNLRMHVRRLTRPCHYTGECPHARDMEDCEAYQDYTQAAKCPSSVSPHPIRRGAITHWLNEGHRKELISERMNVGVKTLEEHYDARTEPEKRKLRREMFEIE